MCNILFLRIFDLLTPMYSRQERIDPNAARNEGDNAWKKRPSNDFRSMYGFDAPKTREIIKDFFLSHAEPATNQSENTEDSVPSNSLFYPRIFREIAEKRRTVLPFALDHLSNSSSDGNVLAHRMENNILSAIEDISHVAHQLISDQGPIPSTTDIPLERYNEVIENLSAQYKENLPKALTDFFTVDIVPFSTHVITKLRDLKGASVGKLVTIRGVVVSASPVRPIIKVHTSLCEMCSSITFVDVIGDKFNPPLKCTSEKCKSSIGGTGHSQLRTQYKACRMESFQEIKLQELRADVPLGALPRLIKILCETELTVNIGAPGTAITIQGALLPDLSHKAMRRMFGDCQVSLVIRALRCTPQKIDYSDRSISQDKSFLAMLHQEDSDSLLRRAVNSIAPEIFGLSDVKKVILCVLAGGEAVQMPDGMVIRGDINVLLTGDPGVAKSQLLKWVANIAPRGVFTSGMGSSGVGLTAAVTSDPVTGENMLEPGTLIFADKGICCIDEFDKMNESDRTALHEVMEQQTISIAKAGIVTTMNCRAAIIAASNPQYGRWNPSKSPMDNINIPTALFSRFDIVWVIRDRFNEEADKNLATHVSIVHSNIEETANPTASLTSQAVTQEGFQDNTFDIPTLQTYLADIKKINPKFTSASTELITGYYLKMRQDGNSGFSVTTRSLLGLVRFSRALARLRYSETVDEEDVREASRLVESSRASLIDRPRKSFSRALQKSDVYNLLRDCFGSLHEGSEVLIDDCRSALRRHGVTENLLRETIDMYAGLKVWTTNENYDTLYILCDINQ